MSLHAMVETFKLRIPPRPKLLALALSEISSDDGEISAYTRDQKFLAWLCSWKDTSNVRRALKWLKDRGLIEIRSGRNGEVSSYRLTYLEDLPHGALSTVFRRTRDDQSTPPSEGEAGVRNGTPDAVRNGTPKSPTCFPLNTRQEKPSLSRGLKTWFDAELWPRFPDPIDRLNTWREIQLLNPDKGLRAAIAAGLERAVAAHELEASESVDGFVRAMPSPRNWLRGRRWEDGQ